MAPPTTGVNDSGVKNWERPWSITEMKQGSSQWTLASDAGVCVCVCVCECVCVCVSNDN